MKNRRIRNLNLQLKRPVHRLLFNRKAASVVLSTIVLTAGVLAMSIAVLYWTYSMGKIAKTEYQENTAANSNAVEERLGFEHIDRSGDNIRVYIINCGKADNITITHVLVLDNSFHYVGSNMTNIELKTIDDPSGNTEIPNNQLSIGADAVFTTSLTQDLTPGLIYNVRIVTERGRNFDGSFVA